MASNDELTPEELAAIGRHWFAGQADLKQKIDNLSPGWLAKFTAPDPVRPYRPTRYPMTPDEFRAAKARHENLQLSAILSAAGYEATEERVQGIWPALKRVVDDYIEGRRRAVFHPEQVIAATSANASVAPAPLMSTFQSAEKVSAYNACEKRVAVDGRTFDFTRKQDEHQARLMQATQKALATLKLQPSVLDGLDQELAVPKAWLDAAAQEKEVLISGTWNEREFAAMTAPFRERYPAVHLRYDRSGTAGRGTRVLVALAEGRYIADVMTSIADAMPHFEEAKALADLRELPAFTGVMSDYVASNGIWASFKLSFRCMAYNTEKVKKQDLPEKWEDLLANPLWRNGQLAISDHPNAWLLSLWSANGEKWGQDFTRRLFNEVKPQKRKEGMTQMTALTVAGEFYANVPAPEWTTQRYVTKGAPVSYHCPIPVPISTSQIVMLDKSPRKNASRIFVNWILSREGQLLQYVETFAVPVHKALQSPDFLPFADAIVGKSAVVRDEAMLGDELQKLVQDTWTGYWGKTSGADSAPR